MIAATSAETRLTCYSLALCLATMPLTSVLEAPDQRASPHDDKEDDSPTNGAKFILNDSIDGGLSGIDVQAPGDVKRRSVTASLSDGSFRVSIHNE